MSSQVFAGTGRRETRGRDPITPSPEAPRSALQEGASSYAQLWVSPWSVVLLLENSWFSNETAAEATLFHFWDGSRPASGADQVVCHWSVAVKLLAAIQREIRTLIEQVVTTEELARVKDATLKGLAFESDSTGKIVCRFMDYEYYGYLDYRGVWETVD
jgi:hypothetical protein